MQYEEKSRSFPQTSLVVTYCLLVLRVLEGVLHGECFIPLFHVSWYCSVCPVVAVLLGNTVLFFSLLLNNSCVDST